MVLETTTPTPAATRDRTIDLVRAASLLVVVVGHWLMAEVSWSDGRPILGNALTELPALQPLTWLLQVMPLFFVAGGVANARSLAAASGRAESSAAWLRQRLGRLVGPTSVLLGVWVVVSAGLAALGVDETVLRTSTKAVLQPLWFLAVHVAVVALAPAMHRAHAHRPSSTVAALVVAVAVLDVARFAVGWSIPALANYLLVWLLVGQAGAWWADGRLTALSRRTLQGVLAASLAVLVTLVAVGPYPLSMVGLPGQPSNMSPPTLCVVLLAAAQVPSLLLARPRLEAWLARPARGRAVAVAGAVAMPVFLWHLTALAVVALGEAATGVGATPGTPAWWALKAVRVVLAAGVLGALLVPVVSLGRRRRPASVAAAPASVPSVTLGTTALVLGLVLVATGGVWGQGSTFVPGVTVPPAAGLAALAAGAALLAAAIPQRRTGTLPP